MCYIIKIPCTSWTGSISEFRTGYGLMCIAHGVQLPVDGKSLSVGHTVILAKSQVSVSGHWQPINFNGTS